jgi:hypothetical protein
MTNWLKLCYVEDLIRSCQATLGILYVPYLCSYDGTYSVWW